jgi:hypothetical protein
MRMTLMVSESILSEMILAETEGSNHNTSWVSLSITDL